MSPITSSFKQTWYMISPYSCLKYLATIILFHLPLLNSVMNAVSLPKMQTFCCVWPYCEMFCMVYLNIYYSYSFPDLRNTVSTFLWILWLFLPHSMTSIHPLNICWPPGLIFLSPWSYSVKQSLCSISTTFMLSEMCKRYFNCKSDKLVLNLNQSLCQLSYIEEEVAMLWGQNTHLRTEVNCGRQYPSPRINTLYNHGEFRWNLWDIIHIIMLYMGKRRLFWVGLA